MASQFAGEHFIQPSQGIDGGFDGGQNKRTASTRTDTIRNVTIKQVLKDNVGKIEGWSVDGHDLQLMTIVAKIMEIKQETATAHLVFNDGTGSLDGLVYISDAESWANKLLTECSAGTYVRAFGVLRSNSDSATGFNMQCYNIRPVTDFNEITYHNLQVIFQRLHLNSGGLPGSVDAPSAGGGAQGFAAPAMGGGMLGGLSAAVPPQMASTGVSALHDRLSAVFCYPNVLSRDMGITPSEAAALLQNEGFQCTQQEVADAVVCLVDNGHLYSTNEGYFKSIHAA